MWHSGHRMSPPSLPQCTEGFPVMWAVDFVDTDINVFTCSQCLWSMTSIIHTLKKWRNDSNIHFWLDGDFNLPFFHYHSFSMTSLFYLYLTRLLYQLKLNRLNHTARFIPIVTNITSSSLVEAGQCAFPTPEVTAEWSLFVSTAAGVNRHRLYRGREKEEPVDGWRALSTEWNTLLFDSRRSAPAPLTVTTHSSCFVEPPGAVLALAHEVSTAALKQLAQRRFDS